MTTLWCDDIISYVTLHMRLGPFSFHPLPVAKRDLALGLATIHHTFEESVTERTLSGGMAWTALEEIVHQVA